MLYLHVLEFQDQVVIKKEILFWGREVVLPACSKMAGSRCGYCSRGLGVCGVAFQRVGVMQRSMAIKGKVYI